ncbi:10583_t:CDS:2, partial [Gigaspora margarita]
ELLNIKEQLFHSNELIALALFGQIILVIVIIGIDYDQSTNNFFLRIDVYWRKIKDIYF